MTKNVQLFFSCLLLNGKTVIADPGIEIIYDAVFLMNKKSDFNEASKVVNSF